MDCVIETSLLDSMPIITSSGKRKGKVATELTDKGYCSTKNLYYHGVKLHALSYHRKGHLPHPEQLLLTSASENDLNVFKQAWSNIEDRTFFGDKIYKNDVFFEQPKMSGIFKCSIQRFVKYDQAADFLFYQFVQ